MQGPASTAERLGEGTDPAAPSSADSGHIQLTGPQTPSLSLQGATDRMEAVPPAVIPSSLAQVTASSMHPRRSSSKRRLSLDTMGCPHDVLLSQTAEERGDCSGLALEEAAGVSAPLYDVVDVLFELQSRGYFRRQVPRP